MKAMKDKIINWNANKEIFNKCIYEKSNQIKFTITRVSALAIKKLIATIGIYLPKRRFCKEYAHNQMETMGKKEKNWWTTGQIGLRLLTNCPKSKQMEKD